MPPLLSPDQHIMKIKATIEINTLIAEITYQPNYGGHNTEIKSHAGSLNCSCSSLGEAIEKAQRHLVGLSN